MNWLNDTALTKMKQKLKPADTLITRGDGFQYIEPRSHKPCKISTQSRPGNLTLNQLPTSPGYVIDDRPDLHIGLISTQLLIGNSN